MSDLTQTIADWPPAFSLAAFASLDSTNDEARKQALAGQAGNHIVWAFEQTKGRGRRGRTWVSEKGNLYLSAIMRPRVSLADAAHASFVTSIAICDALREILGEDCDVACKWPNDILCNGQKISGILLESQNNGHELDWMIVGIGINVAHSPDATPYPCASLRDFSDEVPDLEKILVILLRHLQLWFEQWETHGFQPIRNAWMARAKGIGETIHVNLEDQKLIGTFESLDPSGCLVLRSAQEVHHISAGDVFFPSKTQ